MHDTNNIHPNDWPLITGLNQVIYVASYSIGIGAAIGTCFLVADKKLALRDISVNVSYGKISDKILNLVTANMILYMI